MGSSKCAGLWLYAMIHPGSVPTSQAGFTVCLHWHTPRPRWPTAVWYQILHNAFCGVGLTQDTWPDNKYWSIHDDTYCCRRTSNKLERNIGTRIKLLDLKSIKIFALENHIICCPFMSQQWPHFGDIESIFLFYNELLKYYVNEYNSVSL